jgi:integrase/recombinase XerD
MDKIQIGEIFLATTLDTRRAKEDEKYPVRYRINYQRTRVYHPAGIDLTENEYTYLYQNDLWKQAGKPKIRPTKELKGFETLIHNGFKQIEKHVQDLVNAGNFTLEALKTRMKGGTKNSVMDAFNTKMQELMKNDQIGTATYYRCAMKSISGFTQRDMKFSEVTLDWLRRYEKHLLTEGKSYTTVGFYLRALRAIMNEAKKEGVISVAQYPFISYKIPTAKGRKMALTVAQVGQIVKYQLTDDTDKRYRDLWLFSYLCNGINMNDLLRLKHTDIKNGEVSFYRQKTIHASSEKTEIVATILPEMQAIMDRWPGSGEYIFAGLEGAKTATEQRRRVQNITRKVNERMGKIGEALGFGTISTYNARHSFATVLKRSGASIAYISESLGHTSMKTTANYLDSFEKGERAKNAANLVNFEP